MILTKNKKIYKNLGFTLVELVVAMGIFIVIITLAVSAFISISNLKALTSTMKEVQQKTRITTEMITRLSRQADKVITSSAGESETIELYFNLYNSNPNYGYRFQIRNQGLYMAECDINDESITSCGAWENESNLLGNLVKISDGVGESYFKKSGATMPPTLQVRIKGIITTINDNPYYSNQLTLDTDVVLEGIK